MTIVLIGYRGTGKTTVAQVVASRLGCDWIDSDAEIERHAGKSIAAIFETAGESGFRELESQRLAELTQRKRLVLAVGGGAVLRKSNRDRLKSFGHVVWLTADPATILARISGDATSAARRPNLTNVGGLTEAKKVAALAEAHYIDLMPHNPLGPICTAASVHLAAAVPNFSWLEIRLNKSGEFFYDKTGDVDLLFPVHPQLTGTGIAVSDAPGLGVEFDEELAKSQEWRFWEAPHLRRGDGSVTNW